MAARQKKGGAAYTHSIYDVVDRLCTYSKMLIYKAKGREEYRKELETTGIEKVKDALDLMSSLFHDQPYVHALEELKCYILLATIREQLGLKDAWAEAETFVAEHPCDEPGFSADDPPPQCVLMQHLLSAKAHAKSKGGDSHAALELRLQMLHSGPHVDADLMFREIEDMLHSLLQDYSLLHENAENEGSYGGHSHMLSLHRLHENVEKREQIEDYRERLKATIQEQDDITPEQAAKATAPRIAFSVIELTGKELTMTTLSALHTVGELKQEVARASGTRAEQMRLVLKNEVLDDESMTLGQYGVEAGSQVNAVSQ
jgi:hypothetical protein